MDQNIRKQNKKIKPNRVINKILDFDHNAFEITELQNKARSMLALDLFFQAFKNTLLLSTTLHSRTYFIILETKKLQTLQLLVEAQLKQKCIELQFKPNRLVNLGVDLILRSQRCIIQLNGRMAQLLKQNKFNFYKSYINNNGILCIQITYFMEQFLNHVHATYILNKTMIEAVTLIEDTLFQMLPYLNLEGFFQALDSQKQSRTDSNNDEAELTSFDKIKYMGLLNQVYKNNRNFFSRQKQEKKTNLFSSLQKFSKVNTLLQSDTKFIENLQKQKQQQSAKLKSVTKLLTFSNDIPDELNMLKMYLVQKQFEKYVKTAKKQHLEIYQANGSQYRIVKGAQKKILLNKQRILTEKGSHSNIYIGTYNLHLSDTLFHYQQEIKQQQIQNKVVVKQLVCKRIKNGEHQSSVNSFRNETDFLFHVKDKRSKYIASYFVPMDKNKDEIRQIYAEYYEQNLSQYLQNKKIKSEKQVKLIEIIKFAENILFALIFMVQNSALHRDFKPTNVMIDSNLKCRLIDFGSCCPTFNATQFTVKQKRMLTTPDYQIRYKECPEEIRKRYQKAEYQQHILYDIYSFGVSFKEMTQYVQDLDSLGVKKGVKVSEIIEMIVSKCKQQDPIDRFTFDELLYYMGILKEIASQN